DPGRRLCPRPSDGCSDTGILPILHGRPSHRRRRHLCWVVPDAGDTVQSAGGAGEGFGLMRLFPVMFISAVLTASAMAQNQWEQNVRGVFDLYPTQRLAVEGIADEFVTEVRAAPGFDERHWQIVVAKLSEDQSGLPALPGGNKG